EGRRATPSNAGEGVARVTGLEPATSGVTGRHSNQLSYTRVAPPREEERKERIRGVAASVKRVVAFLIKNPRIQMLAGRMGGTRGPEFLPSSQAFSQPFSTAQTAKA